MKELPAWIDNPNKNIPSESTYFIPPGESPSSRRLGFLQTRPSSWFARLRSRSTGVSFISSAFALCAFFVLLLNLSVFVWAAVHRGFPSTGRQWLYRGDCTTASRINSGFHILINLLSTILLSSSGYCMQYLSAPTRDEVSRAHAKGKWLDIGILSVRNLLMIKKKRVFLWLVLAATSLPLHLFYNSMIFVTYSSNEYWTLQVSSQFAKNPSGSFLYEPFPIENGTSQSAFTDEVQRMKNLLEHNALERLDPVDCIDFYNVKYQTTYGSVLLVSDNSTAMVHDKCHWECLNNNTCPPAAPLKLCQSTSSSGWMCDSIYDLWGIVSPCLTLKQELRSNASDWKPNFRGVLDSNIRTDYCLAERKEGTCFVQSIPHVTVIVLALNLAKVVAMLVVSRLITGRSLVTVGDGISSFLETPDPYMEGMCLASQHDFKKMGKNWLQVPKIYTRTRVRCFSASGKIRWAFCLVLYTIPLGLGYYYVAGLFLVTSQNIVSYGFGTSSVARISQFYSDGAVGSLLLNIVTANSLQLGLSILYFATNGFVTALCAQSEWASYAKERKGLRVSGNKSDAQRSTYFLQLPYRFSVPLLVVFGVLHWLVSQSVFVVDEVSEYSEADGSLKRTSYLGCSFIAILIGLAILTGLWTLIIVQGLWTMQIDMPMLRSCSAVIAASCQPGEDGTVSGAHQRRVQWGVMCEPMESDVIIIGHCGFSAEYVNLPVEGRTYAG